MVKQQVGIAKQQVEHVERQPIPRVVVVGALAILAFLCVIALVILANGSFASALVEIGIVSGVVVILLLARWLVTRDSSASRRVGSGQQPAGEADVRGSSWPPGKFARSETMPTETMPTATAPTATARTATAPTATAPTATAPTATAPIAQPPTATAPAAAMRQTPPSAWRPPDVPTSVPSAAVQPNVPPTPRVAPTRPRVAAAAPRVAQPAPVPATSAPRVASAAPVGASSVPRVAQPAPVTSTSVPRVAPAAPVAPVAPVVPAPVPRVEPAAPVAPVVPASVPRVEPAAQVGAPAPASPISSPSAASPNGTERPTKADVVPSTGGRDNDAGGQAPALHSPGAPSALAEYLDGRAELANLIAIVEARMPPEIEPDAQLDELDEAAEAGQEPSKLSLAQNTKILTRAVEQVGRACEMVAHACELLAERVESDRLERRALADAVSTLAQQHSPSASTPRLLGGSVFATPAWPQDDEIVIDDDPADHHDASVSSPVEQAGSASTRQTLAAPRQSTWSGAPTQSSPPMPSPPKAPRLPSSPNGR